MLTVFLFVRKDNKSHRRYYNIVYYNNVYLIYDPNE